MPKAQNLSIIPQFFFKIFTKIEVLLNIILLN